MTIHIKAYLASAALIALTAAAPAHAEVTLSFLVDNSPDSVAAAEALVEAYQKQAPDVTIEIEQRPGGGEGDNIVKTRLATGEMSDVFLYNSGSLLQALKPQQSLADLSDVPAQAKVDPGFKSVVSADGKVYGVPFGTAMGGGIFYNRAIYKEFGLSVPKTWAEFMANNEKIKAAGKVAVAQTYRDTWTSQLFVLADYYNLQAAVPNFAEDYTDNKAKYASTPAAMKGFEHLKEVHDAGFFNEDFGAASYDDGLRMVATGEAAHYPMLTFAIGALKQNYPENLNDVGFFAQPGDDAAKNGLTVWMPQAIYIPAASGKIEEAKKFADFVGSVEGCKIMTDTNTVQGPPLIDGCPLPADVPPAVTDMLPYFKTAGLTAPALEFVSPIKGPALEQITVEVGSGIRGPAEAAALYDDDVRKQAKQLGLSNW
ncbi:ABC transporter substrate-binding protein [Rhizobium herbae]|uniref:Raffinose/stachyose/melibiose transport system substrate-binding protein n=1 Tax=Rhizobium herbae TaxID=508661 RepID=A0ABS4EV27_9HYPH|nr:extracellular solute-binding protein [Rhizobium herbae]MBP1861768.1 raffinose/stachyose/melibiose transport system substrate-binding protein [Rhizobium herbae]